MFGFCKKETPLSIATMEILRGVRADVFYTTENTSAVYSKKNCLSKVGTNGR
ncbi:MAG: hypothetical protein JNL70_15085 [Saprospiraceae bacterium]|nr:hypothetical protein [Saprospiraceae bacterium]